MPVSIPPPILFESERAANSLVAGIPAAARAIREVAERNDLSSRSAPVVVSTPGGWTPSKLCIQEITRLAPAVNWEAGKATSDSQLAITTIADLKQQASAIISSSGKDGDGIVSRNINRPVSQAISRLLLQWSGARPWHATLAAAMIGVLMFAALIFGGDTGLIIGAILFQFASVVDGVDGEIARATFRTSDRGAMLDSVTDAATNLGFIGGVSLNLYMSGAQSAGQAGAAGFAILALGSALLALQSKQDGGPFTFDALKTRFRERPSRLKQWLIYITMRDFYALAACLAIVAGAAVYLMFVFAFVATGWFAVLCWTLLRRL